MKLNVGLSKKISICFSTVVLLIILNGLCSVFIIYKNRDRSETVSDLSTTVSHMTELRKLINESKVYTLNYLLLDHNSDKDQRRVPQKDPSPAIEEILELLKSLPEEQEITALIQKTEVLTVSQKSVILKLKEGNLDRASITYSTLIKDDAISESDALVTVLDQMIELKNIAIKDTNDGVLSSFLGFIYTALILNLLAILAAVFASNWLSKRINNTLDRIKVLIIDLSEGKIAEPAIVDNQDEFGGAVEALNSLTKTLNRHSTFVDDMVKGDLDLEFESFSEQDFFGHKLMSLRDNIKNIIEEANEAVSQGNLSSRISLENKEGAWRILSESINNIFESIAEPVKQINKIVNAMANGDLTLRYTGDSKGDLLVMTKNLNSALDNIDGLLHQISANVNVIEESSVYMKQSSEEMSYNTGEIASAIAEMSNGAQTQVTKVDESSGLIEAIITSSNEVRNKAENIKSVAQKGNESSEKGIEMANQVVASMEEISQYASKTNDSINVLTERSKEIHRVLSVITGIASQTNLLALNAAIEAAQAGDAGRGFAVVAEEIRKLAEDSRKSASEIEKLVANVQNDTEDAANAIKIMSTSVKRGEETSKYATEAFEVIFGTSSETLAFSEDIYQTAISQLDKVEHVVSITESVVVIAEQTAAGTEEVASSATELSAGMELYYQKTIDLAKVAESFKEGISMVRLSGDSNENTAIFKMKEAYEKEKNLLDSLLNNIPDRIYFKDLESKYIRVSTSVMHVENVETREEILGKSDFDFFNEHAQKSYNDEQEIIKTSQPKLNIIEQVTCKDGSVIYLSTTKLPLTSYDGEVIGTFGVSRDITEIKLAEIQKDQLAKEAQNSLKLVESHNTFIGGVLNEFTAKVEVKAPDGTFYLVNKSVAKDYDRAVEDILGKDDSAFFDKATADKYWSEEKEIIERREASVSLEKVVINNEDRYWFIRKIPVFIPEFDDWGLLGVQRQVEKFQMEQSGYIDGLKNKYPNIKIDID